MKTEESSQQKQTKQQDADLYDIYTESRASKRDPAKQQDMMITVKEKQIMEYKPKDENMDTVHFEGSKSLESIKRNLRKSGDIASSMASSVCNSATGNKYQRSRTPTLVSSVHGSIPERDDSCCIRPAASIKNPFTAASTVVC